MPPDPAQEQGPGVDTLWTFIAIVAVVTILAVLLWTFVVAPIWIPRHSGKP